MEECTSASTSSLKITRNFSASPEAVFEAWTNPKALMQWFAPADTFSTPLAEVDLRVGGSYRIQMKDPSGETHTVWGVYREIRKSERLVFTWQWEGGVDCGGGVKGSAPETCVTVEFCRKDAGTEVIVTHEQFPTEESRDKHHEGWSGCLSRYASKMGMG